MKTDLEKLGLLSGVCVLLIAAPVPTRGADDAAIPVKDHVLFMGLDLALTQKDAMSPVVGGDDYAVEILQRDRRVRVPLRHVERFQTSVLPKFSRISVDIEGLESERCFAPASDPKKDAMAQQMVMETAQSAAEEIAAREWRMAAEAAQAAQFSQPAAAGGSGSFAGAPSEGPSFGRYTATLSNPQYRSALGGVGGGSDDENFDAFLLTFTIASKEPVHRPYGIVRLLVRDPAKPGPPVQVLKFMRLPDLGSKPQKVTFYATGLPPGFAVESQKLHVYVNGRELASNLAENRVELTRDELYQFLVIQRLTAHATTDAPVDIVRALLSNDLRSLVPAAQMNRGVDVTVDASGQVTNIALEPRSANEADVTIQSALRQIRFFPAIVAGKPVPGTAHFVLSAFLP